MSKLSKFKDGIDSVEGAELLSRLIDEPVTDEDMHELFYSGHIAKFIRCNATLVKTLPALDPEIHSAEVENGNYIMTSHEDVGLCEAFHIPYLLMVVDRKPCVVGLSDNDGNVYALRDNSTGEFLNLVDCEKLIPNSLFDPADIYDLAVKANSNDAATVSYEIKMNRWCISDNTYYNFPINNENAKKSSNPSMIQDEPPSYRIIIGALLEMLERPRASGINQSAIKANILEQYPGVRGIGSRSLDTAFAKGNKAIEEVKGSQLR